MSPISVLMVGLPVLVFSFLTIRLVVYVVAGMRAIRSGKAEGDERKVSAGRTSVMNAVFGLALIAICAYLFYGLVLMALKTD